MSPWDLFMRLVPTYIHMMTIEPQLKVDLLIFHTFVCNDTDFAALSGVSSEEVPIIETGV